MSAASNSTLGVKFAKGMKVVKMFYGLNGYREASLGTITKVSKGVVWVNEEGGITYSADTGKEIENFFPPFHCEITPIEMEND